MDQLFTSVIVYGTIILIMSVSNRYAYDKYRSHHLVNGIRWQDVIISIAIYCVFCAIRWNVGRDCPSYMATFYDVNRGFEHEGMEWGYKALINLLGYLGFSHIMFFFVMAFLQVGFIYAALKKEPYVLLFFPLLLFFHGDYWSWMNGMRQNVVCCMFVFSIVKWIDKKYILSVLVILVSTLMHRSAWVLLVFLPLLPLLKRGIILNRWFQLVVLAVCFVFMGLDIMDMLIPNIELTLMMLGYEQGEMAITDLVFDKSFGIRSWALYISYVIVILMSNNLKEYYNSEKFNAFYNLFFISICLQLIFFNQGAIERLLYYVIIFQIVVLGYCCHYLAHVKTGNRFIKLAALAGIIILLSVRTGYELYVSVGDPRQVVLYDTCIGKQYGR